MKKEDEFEILCSGEPGTGRTYFFDNFSQISGIVLTEINKDELRGDSEEVYAKFCMAQDEYFGEIAQKLTKDQRRQCLLTLPCIDEDERSWEKCGPCAQGDKKFIEYCDCATCDHLSIEMLRDMLITLSLTDLEMEENSEEDQDCDLGSYMDWMDNYPYDDFSIRKCKKCSSNGVEGGCPHCGAYPRPTYKTVDEVVYRFVTNTEKDGEYMCQVQKSTARSLLEDAYDCCRNPLPGHVSVWLACDDERLASEEGLLNW